MYFPNSTYRVQLHKAFTFKDLEKVLPYLYELGIKTIYASPIFTAMPGSVHGYDGIDSNEINPEIGTLEEFRNIAYQLRERGMGWIQDFVPNHMAYSPLNPKIWDLMELGPASRFYDFFDFKKDEPIMAPFLGADFNTALEQGSIKIIFQEDSFCFSYYEQIFPLNHDAILQLLALAASQQEKQPDTIPTFSTQDPEKYRNEWHRLKQEIKHLLNEEAITSILNTANEQADLLKEIHSRQYYRLCHWQETNQHINYRRFFTINGLIGVQIEQKEVFDSYHNLVFQLVDEGLIQGLRIDHIDGLYNPGAYLQQLRARLGTEVYIVVEKILEANEALPNWPVQGTTGYDFLAQVNNLLTSSAGKKNIRHHLDNLDEDEAEPESLIQLKAFILEQNMQGEWQQLSRLLTGLLPASPVANLTEKQSQELVKTMLVNCPVYRYYPDDASISDFVSDQQRNIAAYQAITGIDHSSILHIFSELISESSEVRHFWRKFMQLSGPLMAKGMEDTLMYRNHWFLANNEVGDTPFAEGLSATEFHKKMMDRQSYWPLTINATATHDTKRGEDARARLQIISHHTKAWWQLAHQVLAGTSNSDLSVATRYSVLQAIVASLNPADTDTTYKTRLKEYLNKSAREGKQYSTWDNPDKDYEQKLLDFAIKLIEDEGFAALLRGFITMYAAEMLQQQLVQLSLKLTCPGVADIYQGTEYEDLSFVDPDNRRAVDFEKRFHLPGELKKRSAGFQELIQTQPGWAKSYVLYKLLQLRKTYPDLFEKGIYQAIRTKDAHKIAFVRRYQQQWLLVVLPVDTTRTSEAISLHLPTGFPDTCIDVLSGAAYKHQAQTFEPGLYFARSESMVRKACVLMPLFSLGSKWGMGDPGSSAQGFLHSLARSGQRLWQLLPLNPVSEEQSFSPYATYSAFAADHRYISLEKLQHCGWLPQDLSSPLQNDRLKEVPYSKIAEIKENHLLIAYKKFSSSTNQYTFSKYCNDNQHWLEHYAQFVVLKKAFDNMPWYEWPEAYRSPSSDSTMQLCRQHKEQLQYERWKQFVFDQQWLALKQYANALDIQILGDIPFYMAKDSADVWANQEIFKINSRGEVQGMAGVPPDYFSADGQLWGMPVYNWEVLQQRQFDWWIQRLQRNAALFDLVRLDHFRAFYDYWEVPAGALTAKDGRWQPGPQDALFDLIKKHFPTLPFIAEDLGELHDEVYRFKESYRLPGMCVWQFGFDPYSPASRNLPHNFNRLDLAYTGTHDNNTIKGWYGTLPASAKKALNQYTGQQLTSENIHEVTIRQLYQSIADIVVVPFQDIAGLGDKARINTPGSTKGNWTWRTPQNRFLETQEKWLAALSKLYHRI
jgi:malto-oligosyltrehalose synthase/4-alpha-glucanotransferase